MVADAVSLLPFLASLKSRVCNVAARVRGHMRAQKKERIDFKGGEVVVRWRRTRDYHDFIYIYIKEGCYRRSSGEGDPKGTKWKS